MEEDSAKAILLNHLPLKYNNIDAQKDIFSRLEQKIPKHMGKRKGKYDENN